MDERRGLKMILPSEEELRAEARQMNMQTKADMNSIALNFMDKARQIDAMDRPQRHV